MTQDKDNQLSYQNLSTEELRSLLAYLPPHLLERTRALSSHRPDGSANRHRPLNQGASFERAPIVYWTHHAQRTDENPALDVARTLSLALNRPLVVYHALSSGYQYASDRHHVFQLQSVLDLNQSYQQMGIRYVFHLQTRLDNSPTLVRLLDRTNLLITDDFPGEPTDRWLRRLGLIPHLRILAVDTACVVPMRLVGKPFDRAFAFRDATKKLYQERIDKAWPKIEATAEYYAGSLPFTPVDCSNLNPFRIVSQCNIDSTVPPVWDTIGGSQAGYDRWSEFLKYRIRKYASKRNDPCVDATSRMSAYLHYGMVSPMRLAREASQIHADKYLDELLIWRELAYGYCFYKNDFNGISTLPRWAVDTLKQHAGDRRPELYSWERLARALTNDPLWNTCQTSLLRHGELHNNVRMTWGKALLEWTQSPEQALAWLIDLNHRYALDGRDPASYGGILWCLGQFDRPFYPENPVLGSVRPRSTKDHLNRLDLKKYQRIVHRPIAGKTCRVAVVGAGVSGALCARALSDMGFEVQVFEKSKGAGGRSATRRLPSGNAIDHGAPFIEMPSPSWQKLFESWQQDRVICQWEPRLSRWEYNQLEGTFTKSATTSHGLWVGHGGMNRLGKHLVQGLNVHYQTTIDQLSRATEGWTLRGTQVSGEGLSTSVEHSPFDCVVLAIPAPQATAIAKDDCQWSESASKQRLQPTWALLVEFEHRWEMDHDAIHFENHPVLDWISRESSKPTRNTGSAGSGIPEAWVIHANSSWSLDHLEQTSDEIQTLLIRAIEDLGLGAIPRLVSSQAHRWRYAQAHQSSTGQSSDLYCFWDRDRCLGACGDWIAPSKKRSSVGRISGMTRALESGAAMAGEILRGWIESFPTGKSEAIEKQAFQPSLFSDLDI